MTWYTENIIGAILNQPRSLISIVALFISIIVLAGLVWATSRFSQDNVSGNGFSIQWIGIMSLLKKGDSPYSNQVTGQIQSTVPDEDAFVKDAYPRYTSPLYSGFVVFPFTLLEDKDIAHGLWMTAQLIGIFLMIVLSLKLTGWKPAWYIFILFSLISLFSYHILLPWLDGGLPIWAGLFLVLSLVAIVNNRNEAGGIALAMAFIQPQMVILPVIFIIAWAISKKRTVLVVWFFISLILLSVVGLFLVQDWIIQYVRLIFNFSINFPPGTPGIFFENTWPGLGKQLGWFTSGILILILVAEWFIAFKKDFRWLLWTVSLTMVISQWIGIPTTPGNFIELIIPLVLVAAMLMERWPRAGSWASILIVGILFAWEWGVYYHDITGSEPSMQINLIFPLPLILFIGLYWVRWWAIKPRRLMIEELRLSET